MSASSAPESHDGPKINVARVDSITLYEITEGELETLAKGTPTGYLFDLFLALLAIGMSFIVTLSTTTIASERLFAVYTILVFASLIGSAVCLILWLTHRKSLSGTIKTIKQRALPPTPSNTPDPTVKQ